MPTPAPAANAIVSLSYAKSYLNIPDGTTDKDEFLQALINQASGLIEMQTRGIIKLQLFANDIYDGNGSAKLKLRRRPIVDLAHVVDGKHDVNDLRWRNDVDSAWQTLEANPDHIIIRADRPFEIELWGGAFPLGTQNIMLTANYGYVNVPSVATLVCTELVSDNFKKSDNRGGRLGMASIAHSGAGGSSTDSFMELTERHRKLLAPITWIRP